MALCDWDSETRPQALGRLAIGLGRRWFGLGSSEQGAAQRQLRGAAAVGEETDMADAMEAVGHGVQQEPPYEPVGGQRYHLGLAVMPVVLPGEVDLVVVQPISRLLAMATRWVQRPR